MINWKSNVFPGILGRTCDRPCEPACRRGRLEEQPVAICRLKRVAADHKQRHLRAAAAGAGRTKRQARRLRRGRPGFADGRARSRRDRLRGRRLRFRFARRRNDAQPNSRSFVCPTRSSTRRSATPCRPAVNSSPAGASTVSRACSAKATTRFSSAAARRAAATSTFPGGAKRGANIHIGIDWLASVSFGHISSIGRRVVVLGGGNTAMDCCRTARRLGGADVKVVVRSGFAEMKASPWEKEDAMREGVAILNFHAPKAFTHEAGRLTGVVFEKMTAAKDDRGRRLLVADRRTGRSDRMRRRPHRRRPGKRISLDRERRGRALRSQRLARRRPGHVPVEPEERLLRRRRRVWAQEHHHRGRAWP